MVFHDTQFSLNFGWVFNVSDSRVEYRDLIIDRKSRYTVVAFKISTLSDVKNNFKILLHDDYFRKATHNSYAYRLSHDNGSILEWKNDDGEQWAGMCILRELQRENAVGIMIIVTRYFWWIQLYADRFKNIIDACKIFFTKEKEKK